MRILAPVDGSEHSIEALIAVGRFALPQELVLLHVLAPSYDLMFPKVVPPYHEEIENRRHEEGERLLHRVSAFLPSGVHVARRLEYGDPADVIISVGDEVRAEIVVMGARGLSPVKELLFGSVSHAVVNHISIPILIVSHPLQKLHHVLIAVEGQTDADKIVSFLATRPFKESVEMTVLCVPLPPLEVFGSEAEIKTLEHNAMMRAETLVKDVASRLSTDDHHQAQGIVSVGIPSLV
jgi:nucleotide-binding universal stress UspA family protein